MPTCSMIIYFRFISPRTGFIVKDADLLKDLQNLMREDFTFVLNTLFLLLLSAIMKYFYIFSIYLDRCNDLIHILVIKITSQTICI